VADDNEDATNTLVMLLELSGYDVRVPYDGEEALQLAERSPPDADILDLGMQGRVGFEVATTCDGARREAFGLLQCGYQISSGD